MTYPPQPGAPQGDPNAQGWQQQPGYGQQPQYPQQGYPQEQGYPQQPPGYPQTGGWQMPPGPYPDQHNPTMQYPSGPPPGGWGAYDQNFGGQPPQPPQPPKKNRTGLIIAGAGALVVLIALAVTGFVAPGFFLSDDSTKTASSPDSTAQAIVDGLNKKDKAALTALKCADAEKDIDQVIAALSDVSDVKLAGPLTKVSDSEYTATVSLSMKGRPGTNKGTIASAGDKWCWKLVSRFQPTGSSKPTGSSRTSTPPTGTPPSGAGAAFVKDFIGKVNAGDKTGATAMGCTSVKDLLKQSLDRIAVPGAALTATAEGSGQFISAEVGGNVAGKKAQGTMLAQDSGEGFCVSLFLVFAS